MAEGLVKPVFALDFDGTITDRNRGPGYTGPAVEAPPLGGALEWLTSLAPFVQIVIFSARAEASENVEGMVAWLNDNGFGELPVTITAKKPASAFAFFDDLGWHYDGGDYPTVEEVLAFKPWWAHPEKPFPTLTASTAEDAVASLAERAAAADFAVTETIVRTVEYVGGTMHDLEKRLKTERSLAGKVANIMAEKNLTLAQAAADVKDALRYTIVYDAADYTRGVVNVLDQLGRGAGLTVERLRNYWADDEMIARYPAGTYVGVNVLLRAPNGYPFEVQFHTPQSVDVQALNWDFYKLVRNGEADDQVVATMRENNSLVETPPNVLMLDSYAITGSIGALGGIPASVNYGPADGRSPCAECSFYGAGMYGRCGMWDRPVEPTYSCDEFAYGQPVEGSHPEDWNPEPEAINVHPLTAALPARQQPTRHATARSVNRAIQNGYAHAERLEASFVDALALVFDRAADVAAARFEALATDHLQAAGKKIPGGEFCLPAEVKGVSDPVRRNFLKAVMTGPLEDAGLSFDVTNPLTAEAFSKTGRYITRIAQTTQLDVMKAVKASYDDGLSVPDTAKAIQTAIKNTSRTRATMIARTELAGSVNAGSLAAAKTVEGATGDKMVKVWMTAPGARYPRHETYEGLDGQTVALDELFEVGDDQLDHPGDPNGSPEEVINCRCTLSYSGAGDETGDGLSASARLPDWWDESLGELPKDPAAEIAEIERDICHQSIEETVVAAANWTAPSAEEILPINCPVLQSEWGVRVVAAKPGPDVGIAAVPRDGLGNSEPLGNFSTATRDTGHFGTGTYFVSNESAIPTLLEQGREVVGVDLSGKKLWVPRTEKLALDAHRALMKVDDLAASPHMQLDSTSEQFELQRLAIELPGDLNASDIQDAIESARSDLQAGRTNTDSAATRVMKAAGFDGVDVRKIQALDNSRFGSVLYRVYSPA